MGDDPIIPPLQTWRCISCWIWDHFQKPMSVLLTTSWCLEGSDLELGLSKVPSWKGAMNGATPRFRSAHLRLEDKYKSLQGGPKNQLQVGAHNSTYKGYSPSYPCFCLPFIGPIKNRPSILPNDRFGAQLVQPQKAYCRLVEHLKPRVGRIHLREKLHQIGIFSYHGKPRFLHWLVLGDEQTSKKWPFSLLNDEQMSNWVGVKHLPDSFFRVILPIYGRGLTPSFFHGFFGVQRYI